MKNFALQQPLEEWMILEFSQLGFIGELDNSLRPSSPAPCDSITGGGAAGPSLFHLK